MNFILFILSLSFNMQIGFRCFLNPSDVVAKKQMHIHTYSQKAWGFALIWITLSCSWGLAKPINSLLSYNGFFPLSRLTYCTYLIHPTVMMLTSFQCESPIHLKHGMIVSYKLEIYDFSH